MSAHIGPPGQMTIPRRGFLKSGLLAAGGVAAGAVGVDRLERSGAASAGVRTSATLALTPDGDLIVTSPADSARVGPTSDARRGVPGRNWLMVIDLAACD